MASANTGYMSPQALPLRLPRLSYRVSSCDAQSVSSASTQFTTSTASTTPTSPLHSDFCPSPRSPASDMSLPSSPRQSSFAPSSKASSKASSNLTKKRSKFLSGLFGAKEPSAQALQNYERQLMKQGRGRVTPVGMPGVSSAKLPATVPRVNSKWDGVPRTLKEKEKQNDAARQSMSGLSRQLGTSGSGGSEHRTTDRAESSRRRLSRGTVGGASMRSGSSNNLAELYGWETNSSHSGSSTINFSAEHRPTTSQSAPSRAPSRQQSRSMSSHAHPSPAAIQFSTTELSPPSSVGSPNPPSLSSSPMLTPYDLSPATPNTPPPFISFTSPKSEARLEENTKITVLEAPGLEKEVTVKSAGVNILRPPAAAKRKPKPTPLQPSEQRPKTSGADFQSSSILRREAQIPKETSSSRPSLASYFPNVMSTLGSEPHANLPARQSSMRGRRVPNIKLKDQVVAPWHSPERSTNINAEGEKIITPAPEGEKSLRRKSRMTSFRK